MSTETANRSTTRRSFLLTAGVTLVATGKAAAQDNEKAEESAVTPVEDMMREHGVLERMLLIYEEGIRRLETGVEIKPAHLHETASLVQKFIGQYHEVHEEESVFPKFREANVMTDLVEVLENQHEGGRRVTQEIIRRTSGGTIDDPAKVARLMQSYIRMYNPHSAREDTVLFPEFPKLMSPEEYEKLGEEFEEKEEEVFANGGFKVVLARIVEVEKALSIHDLSQFTPKIQA